MKRKGRDKLILDVEMELNWYRIAFTFMVYPGETFEDSHQKVMSSLGHFPYQIHTHELIWKERTGDWGQFVKQVVDIGVFPDVELDDVFKKFYNVVHLQRYELIEDQPIKEVERQVVETH